MQRAVPVETDPAVFQAICWRPSAGVIVTEPAGNGNLNLDAFTDHNGRHIFNVNRPGDLKKSGAIVVSGCTSAAPHAKSAVPNFGSRIDAWAWGENILTTGNPNAPTTTNVYWNNSTFGNTSGAPPIISGVCMLVQNLQQGLTPKPGKSQGRLDGPTMRFMLHDPANGTPVAGSTRPMPDMAQLIANHYLP